MAGSKYIPEAFNCIRIGLRTLDYECVVYVRGVR